LRDHPSWTSNGKSVPQSINVQLPVLHPDFEPYIYQAQSEAEELASPSALGVEPDHESSMAEPVIVNGIML
jgi:hypothetical protein